VDGARRNDALMKLASDWRTYVCCHTDVLSPDCYAFNCKRSIKINEGGLGDVVDNSGDIAGALVTRIPGSRWWRDDPSPAGYSSDYSGH
jgi:hypothetical protein